MSESPATAERRDPHLDCAAYDPAVRCPKSFSSLLYQKQSAPSSPPPRSRDRRDASPPRGEDARRQDGVTARVYWSQNSLAIASGAVKNSSGSSTVRVTQVPDGASPTRARRTSDERSTSTAAPVPTLSAKHACTCSTSPFHRSSTIPVKYLPQ